MSVPDDRYEIVEGEAVINIESGLSAVVGRIGGSGGLSRLAMGLTKWCQ